MSKIFNLLKTTCFMGLLFYITPQTIFAQSTVPSCPNPQVQVDVDTTKDRPHNAPSIDSRTLLSDDNKARFTIDVNRTKNSEPPTSVSDWQMQWQCGINTPATQALYSDPNLAGTTNIYTDVENRNSISNHSISNRCEYDPKNNPVRVLVKAKLGNDWQNFCEASYYVIDADKLCRLDLNTTAGIIKDDDKIILGQPISVSGSDLTPRGNFILKFDNQPIWTDKKTLSLLPGLTKDLNTLVPGVETPAFSGWIIESKYLTQGQHQVSLHRIIRNLGNTVPNLPVINPFFILSRSVNDLIESDSLCSITFDIGTKSNPGKILSRTGATVTTQAVSSPCTTNCTSGGGLACKDANGADIPDTVATAIGCIHTQPAVLVKDLLKFLIGIAGGIAFLLMVLGAFGMITSAGNPESLQAGKDRFTSAILGLLFVVFTVLLLKIIGVDILGLGTFLGIP